MKTLGRVKRKKTRNEKIIAWIILLLLIAVFISRVTNRQVALDDIRWNTRPVEIEIIFDEQEPILIPNRERTVALRGRLNSVFSRNREMLRERPQEGDFKVSFTYEIRVWYALFIPLVQDWGGTATFYADRSLMNEVMQIINEYG
ncbi:MAG: hypothetical protein FWE28_01750 [Oscillospiraceae bacterium]|nr:hypothetical protein [Oscillospiraceae bacterium]